MLKSSSVVTYTLA